MLKLVAVIKHYGLFTYSFMLKQRITDQWASNIFYILLNFYCIIIRFLSSTPLILHSLCSNTLFSYLFPVPNIQFLFKNVRNCQYSNKIEDRPVIKQERKCLKWDLRTSLLNLSFWNGKRLCFFKNKTIGRPLKSNKAHEKQIKFSFYKPWLTWENNWNAKKFEDI